MYKPRAYCSVHTFFAKILVLFSNDLTFSIHLLQPCLKFAYDGKPGIVELYIPKYLIVEFPVINEVFYDGPFFLDEPMPFQIIKEDSSYVTLRIEIPSKYTVVTVSGSGEGSVSPFLRYLFGWGFTFSGSIFFLSLILYVIIKNKLGYFAKKE